MVLSWLLNYISNEIRDIVVYFSTAREIWEDLTVRFSQGNVPRIIQLKKELTGLNQVSMSITAYFTKMRSLTDELNALAHIPKCKSLPTLSQVYSLLLQEESQRASPIVSTFDSVAMNVKSAGKSKKFGQFSVRKPSECAKYCDYCHNPGHNQEKCFFLHGYPNWHRLYGKPKPNLRPKKSAQVISQSAVADGTYIFGVESCTSTFTDSQSEQIAKMIQHSMKSFGNIWNYSPAHLSGKINSVALSHNAYIVHSTSSRKWILDSIATDHIVFNVDLLHNAKSITSVLHLPNGDIVPITHIGNVTLSTNVTFFNVLCVPSFQCNLILISKLTSDNHISVIFSNTNCLIQDLSQKQMVEIGKADEGLYNLYFSSYDVASSVPHLCSRVCTVPSVEAQIWHSRLGHPAPIVLNKVFVIPSVDQSLFTTCDVCLLAKHQRLPFHDSTSSNSELFGLIHCDLWGPYKHHTHGHCNRLFTIVEECSKYTPVQFPSVTLEHSSHIDIGSCPTVLVQSSTSPHNTHSSRPVRNRSVPAKFRDFTDLPATLNSIPESTTSSFMSLHPLSQVYAMLSEIGTIEANHIWDIVPKPQNKNIVDYKWLFKVKYTASGQLDKYKARLVAKGFTQTIGVDYSETYAPVAKMTIVRVVLALAAKYNWHIHQMDVNNAFLYGVLAEEIYMKLPLGFKYLSTSGVQFPSSV
ncbi:uncharacterized protein LOC141717357 [Apium graveolens]|uniref:uncharacterized protein LOC141717357 n=1 Tax=Apium graveolens TaxID=4045 RepID=UPI003D7B8E03